MKKLFVDTIAWIAMNDSRDDYYAQALAFNRQIARQTQLVVTNYILDESYTLLLLNTSYPSTIKFKRKLDIPHTRQDSEGHLGLTRLYRASMANL